jgi:hypothetical protein
MNEFVIIILSYFFICVILGIIKFKQSEIYQNLLKEQNEKSSENNLNLENDENINF